MKRHYVLAAVTQTDEGWVPSLPDECGFLLLGGGGGESAVGLYLVGDEIETNASVTDVPDSLRRLLDTAHSYPPALASAIWHMDRHVCRTPGEFAAEMERILHDRLRQQRTRNHCLIQSRVGEFGYRSPGEYLWVVGYRPGDAGAEVTWVSSDFRSYSNDVRSFDVDPAWLAKRFA